MNSKMKNAPVWTIPVLVIVAIVALIFAARKNVKAVENPLVDLIIITVGVFAFAAVFRVVGVKLNAPGFAAFFGGNRSSGTPTTITQ